MRSTWRVGSFPEEVWIVESSHGRPPAGSQPVPSAVALARMDDWIPSGSLGATLLREIAEAAGDARGALPRTDRAVLLSIARTAISRGRFSAHSVRRPLAAPAKQQPGPGPNPGPSPGPQPQKTFVAIMLQTDEPTPKPVAFKRYKIELPDHTTREGMLDANGCARVEGIDPGTCKVSFPDFHKDDWQAA